MDESAWKKFSDAVYHYQRFIAAHVAFGSNAAD